MSTTTPIIPNILILVRDRGKELAGAFLQGESAIGGTADEELWSFLARHDVEWDGLTVADQDSLRDAFLLAFMGENARRLASTPETPATASSWSEESDSAKDVAKHLQQADQLIGRCLHMLDQGAPQMARDAAADAGCAISDADRAFVKLLEMAPASSLGGSGACVPDAVKVALEALETCSWSGSIGGGKEYDEEKVESALSALRLLTAEGNPEGLRPPVQESLTAATDVPPLGKIESDGEGRETILFEDSDGDGVRITASNLREVWVDSDGFFSLPKHTVASLSSHLQQWVLTGSFELATKEASHE